jgi:uncharacterized membrane protein
LTKNEIKNINNENARVYEPFLPPSLSGKIIISVLMILFFYVSLHKLTNASLWFDEGIEYLVSTMPFRKMILAINTNLQPPLYNFILHFLLKFSTSEYWFRLTSVLFGIGGCVGLYCAINEVVGWKAAGTAIFFYTFLRNVIFYNQECAEYSLVVFALFWTVYFFNCLLRKFSNKKAIGFAIFCVLSIYSQYGAMFPLFGLTVTLLLYYLINNKKDDFKKIISLIVLELIIFVLTLYYCFTKFQLKIQNRPTTKPFTGLFDEFKNFFLGLKINFTFFFTSYYHDKLLIALVNVFYTFFFV